MIHTAIKSIVTGLSRDFPINLFLVSGSGRIRWANDSMLRASGISSLKEIKGKRVSIFGERESLTTQRVLESNKEEILYENHQDRNFVVMKIPYSKTGFRGVLGISIEITKLEQAKRTKNAFIMNMSHDIRTPFCGIIGVLELLHSSESDPEKKDLIRTGLMSGKRLLNFMNDINQISQVGVPLDYTTFDISQMADEIIVFLEAAIKSKGLKLIKQCSGNMVCSNPFRCKHILLNLLGNAAKFTEKGGIRLAINTTPDLVITVQDTGVGIDKSYHEKIFEECFKVKPSYEDNDYAGVGKGLYLVKKYTEELQGNITVQSAANEGATFMVEIPLKPGQAA